MGGRLRAGQLGSWLSLLCLLFAAGQSRAAPPQVLVLTPQWNGLGTRGDQALLRVLTRTLGTLGAQIQGISVARWHPACGSAWPAVLAKQVDGLLGLWLEGRATPERGRLWWLQVETGQVAYQDFTLRPGDAAAQIGEQLALLWDARDAPRTEGLPDVPRFCQADPALRQERERLSMPSAPTTAGVLAKAPLRLELASEITPAPPGATTDADLRHSTALQAALLQRLTQQGVHSPAPTPETQASTRPLRLRLRFGGGRLEELVLSTPPEDLERVACAGRSTADVVDEVGAIVARWSDGWPRRGVAPRPPSCPPFMRPPCTAGPPPRAAGPVF